MRFLYTSYPLIRLLADHYANHRSPAIRALQKLGPPSQPLPILSGAGLHMSILIVVETCGRIGGGLISLWKPLLLL